MSLEHIDDIAELSAIYLKPEAAEFSEDELIANLFALYKMSKSGNSKIHNQHANKIHDLVGKVLSANIGFENAANVLMSPAAPMHQQKSSIMHDYRAEASVHEQAHQKKNEHHMKEKVHALEKELNNQMSDLAGMRSSFAELKYSTDREISALVRKNNDLQRQQVELASHYRNKMNLTINAYHLSIQKMNGEKQGLSSELESIKGENRKLKKAIRDSLDQLRRV